MSFSEVQSQKTAEAREGALLEEEQTVELSHVEHILQSMVSHASSERVSSSIPNISKIKKNREYESSFDKIRQASRFVDAIQKEYLTPSQGKVEEGIVEKISSHNPYRAIDLPDEVFEEHDEYSDFYDEED